MTTEVHAQPLTGKVALVTGGSRGIGAAVVRRLAADGAAVAFTYAASADKAAAVAAGIEAQGGRALAIAADSADPAAVKRAVDETVARFGRLDILVNNAGILRYGLVDHFPLEDFDQMFAVNVRAVFAAVQAAVPHLTDGGRVITIGSVTAERLGSAGVSAYGMTKAAVAGLTRGLAHDLGRRGITANVVQPGPTVTDMNPVPEIHQRLSAGMALGRIGRDAETAGLVAYLAGPDSSFVTGAALTVDGGYLA